MVRISKNLKGISLLIILYFIIYNIIKHQSNKNKIKDVSIFQITVISTYFRVNKSKHSDSKYRNWIKNFLTSVKSPLIIFTDKNSISKELLDLRQNLTTKLYIYPSHWEILKEIEQKRNKNYTLNYKHVQNSLDPEKSIHSSDLYAIWNIKTYITNKIAEENPFNSKMFIYTDSGAWRDRPLFDWPNELVIRNVSNLIQDRILLGQVSNDANLPNVDCIQGGFFMGSKIAISNFETNYRQIHDERFDQGLFVGKEQTIMNLFAFKSNKSHLIARLKACSATCLKINVDIWFFYQYYLASNKYYACNNREKLILIN